MRAGMFRSLVFSALMLCGTLAGESRAAEIPLRLPLVQVGDWVEFRHDGVVYRHEIKELEQTPSELFVHYDIQTLDADGGVKQTAWSTLAASQEVKLAEIYAASFRENGFAVSRREVMLGGRTVVATVFLDAGTGEEYWFSDAIGTMNLVRYHSGDGTGEPELLVLDFGGED